MGQDKIIYNPDFHYSTPKNWVNDPNGLVYLDGEYHLFTQYNPFGDTWGHMSWGHAVSKDLQHWTNLPVAKQEFENTDKSQTMLFSGCAVVDSLNTSGLFKKGFKKGLVALFTSHVHLQGKELAQHQSIMYSADKGRSWQLYKSNPVLDLKMTNFRDPNVIWFPERKVWIMTVAKPLEYTIQFYESKNLINWSLLSEFKNQGDVSKIWECPSLTKIPLENSKGFKWMLCISSGNMQAGFVGTQYFIGDFDGFTFKPQKQNEVFYMDYGKDFYAPIPYFNLPKSQKSPIMIAWANNWTYANQIPSGDFRGTYTIPRKLSIYEENDSFRLRQVPIDLNGIEKKSLSINAGQKINDIHFKSNSYILNLDINLENAKGFVLEILKTENESTIISYDKSSQKLSLDRSQSGLVSFNKDFASVETMPLETSNGKVHLQILVDKSLIEIFGNKGKSVLTDLVFPKQNKTSISLICN